jgi:hypothetical protein
MPLNLPVDLTKGDVRRTASTASEYWDLHYKGFVEAEGPAVASLSYDELTPAQKRARTLELKRQVEQGDAVDTSSDAVDTDLSNQAGDANES